MQHLEPQPDPQPWQTCLSGDHSATPSTTPWMWTGRYYKICPLPGLNCPSVKVMPIPAAGYSGELLLSSQAGQHAASYPNRASSLCEERPELLVQPRQLSEGMGQGHHGDSPGKGLKPPDTAGTIQCQCQGRAQMVRQPGATHQVWPKVVTVTTTNRGSWPP